MAVKPVNKSKRYQSRSYIMAFSLGCFSISELRTDVTGLWSPHGLYTGLMHGFMIGTRVHHGSLRWYIIWHKCLDPTFYDEYIWWSKEFWTWIAVCVSHIGFASSHGFLTGERVLPRLLCSHGIDSPFTFTRVSMCFNLQFFFCRPLFPVSSKRSVITVIASTYRRFTVPRGTLSFDVKPVQRYFSAIIFLFAQALSCSITSFTSIGRVAVGITCSAHRHLFERTLTKQSN